MPTPTRMRLRNYVAMSPLLRKGGVHQRSKSGVRANVKHQMQDEITNWREALEEECLSTNTHSRNDSGDDPLQFVNSSTVIDFPMLRMKPILIHNLCTIC